MLQYRAQKVIAFNHDHAKGTPHKKRVKVRKLTAEHQNTMKTSTSGLLMVLIGGAWNKNYIVLLPHYKTLSMLLIQLVVEILKLS